jgi:hypothetical protein
MTAEVWRRELSDCDLDDLAFHNESLLDVDGSTRSERGRCFSCVARPLDRDPKLKLSPAVRDVERERLAKDAYRLVEPALAQRRLAGRQGNPGPSLLSRRAERRAALRDSSP